LKRVQSKKRQFIKENKPEEVEFLTFFFWHAYPRAKLLTGLFFNECRWRHLERQEAAVHAIGVWVWITARKNAINREFTRNGASF
jgi:hypothetical protein